MKYIVMDENGKTIGGVEVFSEQIEYKLRLMVALRKWKLLPAGA